MKHSLALTLAVILMSMLLFSPVAAAENTEVTTVVPETHDVSLSVGSGGSVSVAGETYTGDRKIPVARQSREQYTIVPDRGYTVDKVLYNGTDVTGQLWNSVFTADVLLKDAALKVSFKRTLNPDPGGNNTGSGSDNPRTGDEQHLAIWMALAILSGASGIMLIPRVKKQR